jgi:hypothetical protein
MKILLLGLTVFLSLSSTAQSPSLTINVIMDSANMNFTRYKIEMKICVPKKMSEHGNWFSHDTSAINFASLKPADITCGGYFDKGTPEQISGPEDEPLINRFKFSNQLFAWENIFVFKISNQSSRAWWPEMYIVMPVKYKSFATFIDLTNIQFQSGKVLVIDELKGSYENSHLVVRQSLTNEKGVEVRHFPLKELLEKK